MRRHRVLAVAGALASVLLGAAGSDAAGGPTRAVLPLAATSSSNVLPVSSTPLSGPLAGGIGTDMAFSGGLAYVGNYNGFAIYDVHEPARPILLSQVRCPGGQGDVTVSGSLLYVSVDYPRSSSACGAPAQSATVASSWEGLRIFDVSNPRSPRYVKAVETVCGSHTNTLAASTPTTDYLYVSSYGPNAAYPGCRPPHDTISIVGVPRSRPAEARVVARPNLFPDGGYAGGLNAYGDVARATTGCHDITAFPARRLAAGACLGDGVLLDIADPVHPVVLDRVRDTTNFAFWHSATFNNEGTKVVFTDELGGGLVAACNPSIGRNRGGNGIYDVTADRRLVFRSFYKIPRTQAATENCVAHNGSLVPLRNRDVMVQAWYQGGVSVWEFTDSARPREIGWFDRGPVVPTTTLGGSWSAYYYRGFVYSSDIRRGLDVLRLTDAGLRPAQWTAMDVLNPQSQPYFRAW